MEPELPRPSRPHHLPHLFNLPVTAVSMPSSPQSSGHRTAGITPSSSPGIFSSSHLPSSPHVPRIGAFAAISPLPNSSASSPVHVAHQSSNLTTRQPVRETHTANVDRDDTTGRKTINEYQVLEEIGRGQHGKVKLAQDNRNARMVAIKIIPRLSKTRRLGKVSAVDPQQNTKREIAILKKIRHENIVALLEVIDDPELQKIYMVLEYVERGEMTWRKKGLPNICYFERYRFELGVHGKELAPGECNWHSVLERKATICALKEARANGTPPPVNDWTTLYHVTADDDDQTPWWYVPSIGLGPDASLLEAHPISRATSRAPSRVASSASVASATTARSYSSDASCVAQDGGDDGDDSGDQTPGLLHPNRAMSNALDGSMFGAYLDEASRSRPRSPSVADSVMSHLSGLDFNSMVHDPYADDFSYVPCFSIQQARIAFRDTVLGLEYLHYHGVVHRDIKPANLLWSKGFHVKISDFSVSYFGRPIRDGEPTVVSEAEARNFDDDRELSKTVGTPAFFAPELCYTDIDKEPPRVSEQIDVWSLGVTLYCLLYARIPFLAEDEFSMFRKIATEEAYVPRRRLKPVGIYTDPTGSSLYSRTNVHPYRSDADPEYEELSRPLLDLLHKMLIKNPDERIRLRDIKRHPWVTEDIANVSAWLSDTDPARTQDRDIQVDEEEIGDAVVPLNFLQRARSAVKRAVEKVIHSRPERDTSTAPSLTRNRAMSSAASSSAELAAATAALPINIKPATHPHDSPGGAAGSHSSAHRIAFGNHSHSPGHAHSYSQGHQPNSVGPLSLHQQLSNHSREARRKSLRGCESTDYFATVTQTSTNEHHPLAQSQIASPYVSPGEKTPNSELAPQLQPLMPAEEPALPTAVMHQPATPAASSANASAKVSASTSPRGYHLDGSGEADLATLPGRVHAQLITNAILSHSALLQEVRAAQATPLPAASTSPVDLASLALRNPARQTRDTRSSSTATNSRTQSVDRASILFANPNKRSSPVLGLSMANAPGSMQQQALLHTPTPTNGASDETETPSSATQKADVPISAIAVPLSKPVAEERPATAYRARDALPREVFATVGRSKSNSLSALPNRPTGGADSEGIPSPLSPNQLTFPCVHRPGSELHTARSSSSVSFDESYNQTPLTSPSERAHYSFVSSSRPGHRKSSSNAMTTFQSDPSLPALFSGASSVSADDAEIFGHHGMIGVTDGPSLDLSDYCLTPPACGQEHDVCPLDQVDQSRGELDQIDFKGQQGWGSGGAIPVELDNEPLARTPLATPVRADSRCYTDEDDDSDSDNGIMMMAKVKKKVATPYAQHISSHNIGGNAGRSSASIATARHARRRDTNTSIGSTDTAKKVGVSTTDIGPTA
ncbi:hypothetical protein SEPCBS119000_005643 [Sporothrix epigloea]|uniref:Protein kinase domain-containing protein n=1 Tax=Sporothrix epigloea TaxID=1892477 RepID=A0ABP0E0Z6_9PEZI